MIFQIRLSDEERNVLVADIELWVKTENGKDFLELRSVISPRGFGKMLLHLERNDEGGDGVYEWINDIEDVSELRGYLWERWKLIDGHSKLTPEEQYSLMRKEVREILAKIVGKYNKHLKYCALELNED